MSHALLRDPKLHDLLFAIDQDLAAQTRAAGCPACGGTLHSARYPRRPRGGPDESGLPNAMRLSFCCAREGCRRRTTPPSVRYLGRRVYLGAVVVLATAMQAGITAARATRLRELLGVSVQTLKRWRRWWQESFVASAFWGAVKGRLMPPVPTEGLPSSLLERFAGDEQTRLLHTLKFLCPLTTRAGGLAARLAMDVGNPQKMLLALHWPRS